MTAYDKDEALRLIGVGVEELFWDAEAADRGDETPSADYVDGWNDAALAQAEPLLTTLRIAVAEVDRLTSELDHIAPASERDHLSRASRRMVDTVMGDREVLRGKLRTLRAELETDDPAQIIATMRMVIKERDDMQGERDHWRARAQIAELEAQEMRPVVAAAESWAPGVKQRAQHARMPQLELNIYGAVTAYTSGADARADAIAKIAGDAPSKENHDG